MTVDLNTVYQNADSWTLNITRIADALKVYAEPAGDFVMVWMHAPLIMISPGFYFRLGHLFVLILLFAAFSYLWRSL